MSHLHAAHVELPVMLAEMSRSGSSQIEPRRSGSRTRSSKRAGPPDEGNGRDTDSPTPPHLGEPGDLEMMGVPGVVGREAGERDPLLLRDRIVSDAAIESLKQRNKGRRAGKKVADFYSAQNEHIQTVLKPLSTLSAEGAQDAADNAFRVKVAVNVSFGCNCVLAVLQLYAAISSGSLALFATMIDSVCDPLANLILWLSHRAANKVEGKNWPLGGSRFETVGNIIFSHLMFAVNLVLIVQSIQEFVTHDGSETNDFNVTSIIAVAIAFGVKLMLFILCFAIRRWSSQVQVLWEDHRNDLFTNGFGILTSAGGSKLAWWIDPMGAIIIAICIMFVWARTSYYEFKQLAGVSAPADYQNLVTYKAMTFSPEITSVDTVKIYHSGPQYFVEVDIVLPPEMPLWKAHDLAQDLQDQIEALPDVDRCFVHVDHEVDHKPEHRKKV